MRNTHTPCLLAAREPAEEGEDADDRDDDEEDQEDHTCCAHVCCGELCLNELKCVCTEKKKERERISRSEKKKEKGEKRGMANCRKHTEAAIAFVKKRKRRTKSIGRVYAKT